jgi:hypothetical protein
MGFCILQEDCRRDYCAAKIEKDAAADLLQEKIVSCQSLKKEVDGWDKKFKVLFILLTYDTMPLYSLV